MSAAAPDIAARLEAVRARVAAAASAAGRDPSSVRIVAVSKKLGADLVRAAWAAGQRDFGENYVQAWREKANALAPVLVGLVGGGSIVFSLPFFYKNLMRLGLRWASVVNKDIKQEDFDKNYNPKAKGAKRR